MPNSAVLVPPIINPQGKMPVGVSDFTELVREDYCFVDKSLFIQELLDSGDKITLITRPRRFGKTINLNMLCCFLRQELQQQNDLFDGLAISQAADSYQQERGKRPVLFVSLRTVKESNWDDSYTRMITLLSVLAEESSRDAPVTSLPDRQQHILQKVISGQATPAECEPILAILTQLLTLKHNGMTPWVIMDEYDAPMQAAYQHGYYKQMRNLMKGLLGDCLKDNPFLHRAVLTGIVRVAKEDIFSDLNNLGVFGVSQDRFASCFGFTESEIQALLAARDMQSRCDIVRTWYDGYSFGRTSTIYNPWSVINYLANPNDPIQPYWVNTSSNHLVHELLTQADSSIKQGLYELLSKTTQHSTSQPVNEYVPLRNLHNNSKNLWGLLLASGYITTVPHHKEYSSPQKTVPLRIPNKEVLTVYSGLIDSWMHTSSTNGYAMIERLVAGDAETFAADFAEFVHESFSYFDVGGQHPERFYHGFMLGMLQHLQGRYVIASQQESGAGRYDLCLQPIRKQDPGFVFEFKSCPHLQPKGGVLEIRQQLQEPAQQALQQIIDKAYHTQLQAHGVDTIIALGMAFGGKQVAVAHTKLL